MANDEEKAEHQHVELKITHCENETRIEGVNLPDDSFQVMQVLFAGLSVAMKKAESEGRCPEVALQFMHVKVEEMRHIPEGAKLCLQS